MDNNLWQLGIAFREQSKVSEDQQWSAITSKLTEYTRSRGERMNNLDLSKSTVLSKPWDKFAVQDVVNKCGALNLNKLMSAELKMNEMMKHSFCNHACTMNSVYQKSNVINSINGFKMNTGIGKYSNNSPMKEVDNHNGNNTITNKQNDISNNNSSPMDKRFKTLPLVEILPRNEVLGGYIFVCNNDTMQEDLKRQLFGLPPRYRDSVRTITPGLPLFLYNYTTHQLHGIFEAASFGGTNIDPTAWEDKKCKGESRFPAQVKIRVRKICKPLEEDEFRPVLHHYDGPKFRLELSMGETLDLLDLCGKAGN